MTQPTAEQIERLKQKYPDRQLHLVEVKNPDDAETFYFVMTGPTEDEYKLFVDATLDAREKAKNLLEKNEKMEEVAKKAAQRQVVLPERAELLDILFKNPGFAQKLADKIPDHAGTSAEVRSKKL